MQLVAAKKASLSVQKLSGERKSELLLLFAEAIQNSKELIVESNLKDLSQMDKSDSRYDRLILDAERIDALVDSLHAISKLPDPTGQELYHHVLDNGLELRKITVPLGVVGVIYESRPNVTIDVAALCIQSGNACLLRGGSDAWYTNQVLVTILREVLQSAQLDPNIIQLLPASRECVAELLQAVKYVDIIIPRGSHKLIDFVRKKSKIPVIETGAGVCHTYIDESADINKAVQIVHNAKVSRPSVCNALDTVLINKSVADEVLVKLAPLFKESQVAIHADPYSYTVLDRLFYPQLSEADESDYGKEFLSMACSVRVVSDLDEALEHIQTHSSKHSESIVSQDAEAIQRFLNTVDAAVVYSNASTRFTDGGVFGLGAEIGISTQKLHARGPFALEKLVTEKWIVKGDGQVRE